MIRIFRAAGAAACLALLFACVDGDAPTTPGQGLSIRVPIQASIVPSPSNAAAEPINRIRAVAERVPDGLVLGSTVLDVSETADSWEISLELPVAGAGVTFVVYLELIHVDGSGSESIQFSGRTQPYPLVAGPVGGGESGSAVEVEVVRGPPANLFVTGITIAGGDRSVEEGDAFDLSADVEMTGSGDQPTVFWTSLDPAIVSISGTTATAAAPGSTSIVATAGPVADTVAVTVTAGPTNILVTPDTILVSGPGGEGTFSAEVFDSQGLPYIDQTVTWITLDPTVIESLGDGTFRALIPGVGHLQARSAADTSLTAQGVAVVPDPAIEVGISKVADASAVQIGDTVTFTVVVTSSGIADARGVLVTDTLPTGLVLLGTTTTGGAYDPGTGTWSVGDLATGSSETLTVRASVAAGTAGLTLTNVASAVADTLQNDSDPSNNVATAAVQVASNEADVSLTKSVDSATPLEGDTVTFTLTVTNLGPGSFTSITVQDVLPTGLTFVSAVPNAGAGSYDQPTGHWVVNLPAGSTASLALKASVDVGTAGQTITNTARLTSTIGALEKNTANNTASASVVPLPLGPSSDISISKTVDIANPTEGDTINFKVEVVNLGPDTATTLRFDDVLPTGLTLVVSTPGPKVNILSPSQFQVDTLAPGDTAAISIRMTVDPGTAGTSIVNTATVVSLDQNDFFPGNNASSVTVNVQGPPVDLAVAKSIIGGTPNEGDTVQFNVSVTNSGSQPATNVVVFDSLMAPASFVSAAGGGSYSAVTGRWTIATLGAGTTATLTLQAAFALGSGGTSYTNVAYLESLTETDISAVDDTASATANIQVLPVDIEVKKTASGTLALVGQSLTYAVTAKNVGTNTATNVVVTDTIPPGFTVDSTTVTAGTLANDTTWTLPSMLVGDSAKATWHVTVGAGQVGNTLVNWARLTGVDQNDTNAANDQDSVAVAVVPDTPPVVTISSPVNGDVYDPADTISFAATASDVEDGVLTPSIAWTSDQDGSIGTGAGFSSFNLSPGPHVIAASVTDSQGTTVADTVSITVAIISTAPTLNVPLGGSASLPISLSAAAPAGGITVNVSSANTSVTAPATATVFIPGGAFAANATLNGLVPGTTTVTISSAGFGSSTSTVSVTAQLNIIENSISFGSTFPQTFRVRLESQGTPIAAPAGGLPVSVTSSDPTCAAVPATVTIPAGLVDVTDTVSYGGSAALTCNAMVTATASSIAPDSVPVTVTPPPGIALTGGGTTIGSGLQISKSGFLGVSNHGGTTARVTSLDTALVLVSPNSSTPGADFVDVNVNNGSTSFSFYVQALDGVIGTAALVATAPGFSPDTVVVNVVQGGVILASLSTTTTSLSGDDLIYAYVGIPSGSSVSIQSRRAGAPPLIATFAVSDTTVGLVKDSISSRDTVTAPIVPGLYYTPSSLNQGGVFFDPNGAGSVTLTASVPGFAPQALAAQSVSVTAPGINTSSRTVGSGLHLSSGGSLQAPNHGGVTLRITSTDSSRVVLAPDAVTPGTGYIDIPINNGSTGFSYFVAGLEGQTGTVDLTFTAPGFVSDTATITVVQPGIILAGLATSRTSFDPDDHFYAYVGVPSGNSVNVQNVRAGGVPVQVTFASSDTTVGFVKDSISGRDTVMATIPIGLYYTPTSVATGGVSFDPSNAGATTVTASAPGFIKQPSATSTVTVSAPLTSVASLTVGAGLQVATSMSLGASGHGGVTVRIESLDSTVMVIAPTPTVAGQGFVDVVVPNGQSFASFTVQGIEGMAGSIPIAVSAPGFVPDTGTITVVQPGVVISGLGGTSTTFNPDDHFYAYVGVPSGNGVSIQNVRGGAAPLTVTFQNDSASVAQLKDSVLSAQTLTAQIPAGLYYTPTSVPAGGVSFDPTGPGTTFVHASIPGYVSTPTATRQVNVSVPGITVNNVSVGAGLQRSLGASLGASQHGGVTVRVTSSNPAVMLVSPNGTTAGTPFIDVVVNNGQSFVNFYTQGVEGTTGATTVTVSASGFTDGSSTVTVIQPGVILAGLGNSQNIGSDDHFYAYVGIPSGSSVSVQNVRAGGTPLVATFQSDAAGVGIFDSGAGPGATVTSSIPINSYFTPTSVGTGGVAFRPVASGTANVTVTIPGFITQPNGTRTVTVN